MDINTFYSEYSNFTKTRKEEGLRAIFEEILSNLSYHEDLIFTILDECVTLEQDDYFGTEGLRV